VFKKYGAYVIIIALKQMELRMDYIKHCSEIMLLCAVLLFFFAACGSSEERECSLPSDCGPGQTCRDGRCVPAADADADADADDVPGEDADMPEDAAADEEGDSELPIGAGCSTDLRSVLDYAGNVLYECPPDEGCHEGRCIPACEAAEASNGTVSCRFMVTSPPSYPPALPPCLAVFLANAWPHPAGVTVSRGSTTFDVASFGRIVDNERPEEEWDPVPDTGIPENEVAVLFLSSHPDAIMPENLVPLSCPVTPAVDASTVVEASGISDAFVITTDIPVRAYDILPYGGARSHFPSAQLLLPTSTWGTDYVVIGPPPGTHPSPGPLWIHVAALENNTTVTVRPTVDLPAGGGLPAVPAGSTVSVDLNSADYLQWELPAGPYDPSGTLVVSDRHIAVMEGNRFLRLQPETAPGGDSTHQQLLPVNALSHEYVAVPYETRRADLDPEVVPYRLVGAVDGTVLAFDPDIPGAPATLHRGEMVEFMTDLPFHVFSQDAEHPFAAVQLMTTANVEGGSRPGATAPGYEPMLGDEECVILFPPAQFLSYYVFFTDPTYATTNLSIIRIRGEDGFMPVRIDCLGDVGGFRPVGASSDYEAATVDLVRAEVGVETCTNGRHIAQSEAPFGIIVWGLDSYSSYAYPAGGNAATLADIPPLL